MADQENQQTCETCAYADPHIGDNGIPFLECHRYPPHIIHPEGEPLMMWPQVHDGDWCGEHTQGAHM